MYKFALRCRSLFRSQRLEEELDEELRFHLEQQIRDHLDRGRTRDEATRVARLALGGVEQQKEACRDARHTEWIDRTWRDIRCAMRVLRGSPGFALVAILSLAIGIGANTAIFQLIDAIRLRHLPVPRADELADVRIASGMAALVCRRSEFPADVSALEAIRSTSRRSRMFAWAPRHS